MELSTRVYHYEENAEIISIYKNDEKFIVKYKQSYEKNYKKIASIYDFEIITDTDHFDYDLCLNAKIIIMEVHTDTNPKPEKLYVLYDSNKNIKTIYVKYDYLFKELNGSYTDNYLIFEQKYNQKNVDDMIVNKLFTYDKKHDLWKADNGDDVMGIKVSDDNIFDTLLKFKYLESKIKLNDKKLLNNEIKFSETSYDLRFEMYEKTIILGHNDYSYSDTIFSILEGVRMERIGKSYIYCGFSSSDKTYHYFQIIFDKPRTTDSNFLQFKYLQSDTQLNEAFNC